MKFIPDFDNGAYCVGCERQYSREDCWTYCFGEGDQPDTCPFCGARIQINLPPKADGDAGIVRVTRAEPCGVIHSTTLLREDPRAAFIYAPLSTSETPMERGV